MIDISQPLDENTAPWPGDVPFHAERTAKIEEGGSVNLGAFRMSAHLGTHTDAPFHFDPEGVRSDGLPLAAYWGPARVVAVEDELLRPEHVAGLDVAAAPRVLFKTRASERPVSEWSDDGPPVDPETIRHLAGDGAVLLGTDAPSVDPVDSRELPAHHTLARCGLANLENLALDGVAPGRYELAALPLRIVGMDAAPVRAVLRPARK
ncbi:MAG: kynurenine formamidase [Bacteroidetes bacterium QS_9_68_14]|nr:MAG: kynurenine formamidase [Bacteroidetes bacterium QS_9_68_14]